MTASCGLIVSHSFRLLLTTYYCFSFSYFLSPLLLPLSFHQISKQVCFAAQTCKSLDFESETDIWFRSPPNIFKCSPSMDMSTPVTLFNLWKKIIVVCFLQAAGTAIGEIPPVSVMALSRSLSQIHISRFETPFFKTNIPTFSPLALRRHSYPLPLKKPCVRIAPLNPTRFVSPHFCFLQHFPLHFS